MLTAERQGPVLVLTLNRPEVRNAFNDELISQLSAAFDSVPTGVRVVLIEGNGPTFCAGGDLNWMRSSANLSKAENAADALNLAILFQKISHSEAITVANIHGAAFGGGCGLVSAVDFGIAVEKTKFCFSETKLGLIPATISPHVVAKIGVGNARAYFTTSVVFESDAALTMGLIHRVVSSEERETAVAEIVNSILSSGPQAVLAARNLASVEGWTLNDYANALAEARSGAEGKEGVGAFLDKRRASFVEKWVRATH